MAQAAALRVRDLAARSLVRKTFLRALCRSATATPPAAPWATTTAAATRIGRGVRDHRFVHDNELPVCPRLFLLVVEIFSRLVECQHHAIIRFHKTGRPRSIKGYDREVMVS